MSGTTKERILEAAKEIMLQKSFCSVGLNEILASVKVPKGSFYHYFKSKEQFGAELLRHYLAQYSARLRRILLSTDLDPRQRILAFMDGAVATMMEGECKQFCLAAKLGSEVSTFSEPMRAALSEGISEWRTLFEKVIREGQEQGVIRKDLPPEATAALIQDLWQGAMHRSQIERSASAMRGASDFIRRYLAP